MLSGTFLCQWQCKKSGSIIYRLQMQRHVPICHPQIHAGSQDGLPSGKSTLMRRGTDRQEYSFARQIIHHRVLVAVMALISGPHIGTSLHMPSHSLAKYYFHPFNIAFIFMTVYSLLLCA